MNTGRSPKAVILAAGLGTRLRRDDPAVELTTEQASIAATGVKALIPIDRPFLDYVLTAVADAGFGRVCLVIGPDHDAVREYYTQIHPERLSINFAIQTEPKGTADALAAAETFSGNEPFLLINSDNYYPVPSLQAMRELAGNGVVGFERQSLFTSGILSPDRLQKFAVVLASREGDLQRIIEKPDPEFIRQLPEPVLVNMNCWRFEPSIFTACREIKPSPRGEYEIPDAVMYAIEHLDARYRVVPTDGPVLDLSSRSDIAAIAAHLQGVEVHL